MTRLRRLSSVFVLSLLLLGMQLGGQLHALEHFGEALRQTPDHSLAAPADEACPICVLFAGGANAVGGDTQVVSVAFANDIVPQYAPASVATRAPSYYLSRAPPSLR